MSELEIVQENPSIKPQIRITSLTAFVIRRRKPLAVLVFMILFIASILLFIFNREDYSGTRTSKLLDAIYFSVVTISTVGFGDVVPTTDGTKIFTICLVLTTIIFSDFFVNEVVALIHTQQERLFGVIWTAIPEDENAVVAAKKTKMVWKLILGILILGIFIGVGALVLYFVEKLDAVDSFYVSVMSVTTVGFGDKAFKTVFGRIFAVVWILLSTIVMASLFILIGQARDDESTKLKELSTSELEYVVWKLVQSGKITKEELDEIACEYKNLDVSDGNEILN